MEFNPLTIKQFLKYLVPRYVSRAGLRCPDWPADIFAISAALLEKSGGYTKVGTEFCPCEVSGFDDLDERNDQLDGLANQWRTKISKQLRKEAFNESSDKSRRPWKKPIEIPETVQEWWEHINRNCGLPVSSIVEERVLLAAIVNLLAVADECLSRVGMRIHGGESFGKSEKLFWQFCEVLLAPLGAKGSTLCREIDPTRIRVLPKSQIPAGGLSVRSMSHYLAMCPPIEIPVHWHSADFRSEAIADDHCNILLVPWPYEVAPVQFQPWENGRSLNNPDARRFVFDHDVDESTDKKLLETVGNLLDRAQASVGKVHMVVLPELSITDRQHQALSEQIVSRDCILISGVADDFQPDGPEGKHIPRNVARTTVPAVNANGRVDYEQFKHHRWKLDSSQIVRYGLSSTLNPRFDWWEAIELYDRHINFMRPKSWLSMCVLLCEDLAQFDPVGRFVRAVAPDLVIALLMDGPQLASRWPARYATVLADDPGSAVLTLTSLGMNALSRKPNDLGAAVPRTIALWKDPLAGLVPIDLPSGKNSAILTVRNNQHDHEIIKWTADGRSNDYKFGTPTYGGVHFL